MMTGTPRTDLGSPRIHVSYGMWERDPDVTPILRPLRHYPSEVTLQYAYRRARYETWDDENGQRMGRWDWERRV